MKKLEQFGIPIGREKHEERAIYSLALIYGICNNRINNYLKKYNLSVGKFNILVAIKVHGGEEGLSQVNLSKHLIVTPSNMTKLIDKLEKDGMVTRSPLEGDRRVNIIKVTKPTAKLIDNIWDEYVNEMKLLMEGLNLKDKEAIDQELLKWLQILI